MASTRWTSPQVGWRRLACFRVAIIDISAGQIDFWAWFDSRQLHKRAGEMRPFLFAGQSRKLWPVFCKPRFVFDSASTGLGIGT
jgi:hypothetical protein